MSITTNPRLNPHSARRYLARGLFALLLTGLTACGGGGGGGGGGGDDDDDDEGDGNNQPVCRIDMPAANLTIDPGDRVNYSATVSDADGNPVTIRWEFPGGVPGDSAAEDPGQVRYNNEGVFETTLDATDNQGGACQTQRRVITVGNPPVSINSTSQDSLQPVNAPVSQQAQVLNGDYSVLAINDLGMHCGDLDTRIASILPPFQVLLAQVIRKGADPTLNPGGVILEYSAATNPNDPILQQAGIDNGIKLDGTTYKTNFWNAVTLGAYDAFYPGNLTPLAINPDEGLPVPNVEDLYIGADGEVNSGDERLSVVQHAMPGLPDPYDRNTPQRVEEHYDDKPFFVDFPFGYVAADVNWHEAAGIPFAAFDDFGRENAYPLVRVAAKSGGATVATVDTVLPISGEANCRNCHADPADVQDSRSSAPTDTLRAAGLPVATSLDDPDGNLPVNVSVEYGTDINILRLHDLKHGARYVDTANDPEPCDITLNNGNGNASCLTNRALLQQQPVVCQVCHYTPALDLAQVGPQAGAPGTAANGRNQLAHQSNSRVMHHHHGQFRGLFPSMPAPVQDNNGNVTNQARRLAVLEDTCYQCHPGSTTRCLRGALYNADMLCNDCHGDMLQVGADFSAGVSPDNPGAFELGGDFYDPDDPQPRVPWANEPGCGSCHTGDADSNLAAMPDTLVNTADTNGNTDGIRLRQAWRTGDSKATPIVPVNKRFAEPAVPATFNGFRNPGAGNPQLYRVSTGHGGVMCEGCHGATHAEWPNANPNANDNVTAVQLQGHTGTLVECQSCHGTAMNNRSTLNGPHGMHPVGGSTAFARGGHEDVNRSGCADCHGPGNLENNRGTVLSLAKADRVLFKEEGGSVNVPRGTPIGCSTCHD